MATLATIKTQVIALLSIGTRTNGVKDYSSAIGDGDWTSGQIERGISEAQIIVAEYVCRAKNPSLRGAFLQTDQAITNGASIPNHYGEISNVKIIPYDGANALKGVRESSERVASYIANNGFIHSEVAHNAPEKVYGVEYPASTAGRYAIDEDIFTFTGYSATISYADINGVDLADYPATLEVPITHIAIGLLAQDGTVSEKFGEHMQIGMSILQGVVQNEDEENRRD